MAKKKYDNSSIKALKGAERVRTRPGVMFGSDNLKGAFHTFKEILGNSLDESRGGFGNVITVKYYEDNAISISDNGRGVPMGYNRKEKRYNWDLIFNELYAGGKYDGKGDAYKYSVGLNGLGAAAVQYVSEYFIVESYRDGKKAIKNFEHGIPIGDKIDYEQLDDESKTGTFIKWKVDKEVFRETQFTFDMFKEYCEGQAHINEVNFILENVPTGEIIKYEGLGIEKYLKQQVGEENVIDTLTTTEQIKGKDSRGNKYSAECELCLLITEETTRKEMHFHNTATMTEGIHLKAAKDALLHFFKNLEDISGVRIMPYDYGDYISLIVSSYSNITSFANQTKDGVDNKFLYNLIYKTITDVLEEGLAMEKKSVMDLTENVLNATRARAKAKELEKQQRMIKKTSRRRSKAEKYVDCRSNDPSKKELFILEGDSALGSCKDARDGSFQALLPVRGKTLNCLKATAKRVLKNSIIKDIITTVGTGVSLKSGKNLFDMSKLEFDKIIFTTDADVDGFQIRVLLYTVFYRLMPDLLREGKVYVAETPLFEFELKGNNKSRFAYTIKEKDQILREIEKEGLKIKRINRSKGLGENNPDMLWHTTMNPETRRLVRLDIDIEDKNVAYISDMLFGKDKDDSRKEYIIEKLKQSMLEDLEIEKELVKDLEKIGQTEKIV